MIWKACIHDAYNACIDFTMLTINFTMLTITMLTMLTMLTIDFTMLTQCLY